MIYFGLQVGEFKNSCLTSFRIYFPFVPAHCFSRANMQVSERMPLFCITSSQRHIAVAFRCSCKADESLRCGCRASFIWSTYHFNLTIYTNHFASTALLRDRLHGRHLSAVIYNPLTPLLGSPGVHVLTNHSCHTPLICDSWHAVVTAWEIPGPWR